MLEAVLFAVWLIVSLFQVLACDFSFVQTLLVNSLVINIGLGGLWGFLGHTFLADYMAESCNWARSSPFQFEVAVFNLALGVMGVACYWLRGDFWIATITACSIYLLGASCGHAHEMIVKKNFSMGNAGPAFFMGIINPIVLIELALAYFYPVK